MTYQTFFLYLTSFLPFFLYQNVTILHSTIHTILVLCRITYQMFIGQFNLLFRILKKMYIFSLLCPRSFLFLRLTLCILSVVTSLLKLGAHLIRQTSVLSHKLSFISCLIYMCFRFSLHSKGFKYQRSSFGFY